MKGRLPKPGIHKDIPFAEYCTWDALNQSKLKPFLVSPKHAQAAMRRAEDSEAMARGDAAHAALLQPEVFDKQYVREPQVDKRTKAGKAKQAEWEASVAPGAITVSHGEYEKVCQIRDAVLTTPQGKAFLRGVGINEVSVLWRDPATDLLCKARIDRLCYYDKGGYNCVLDVKTTRVRLQPTGMFMAEIARYNYHFQMAWYLDGLAALEQAGIIAPADRQAMLFPIESEYPFGCRPWGLMDEDIECGRAQYRRCVDQYLECVKSERWPGYPESPVWPGLPKYAYTDAEEG